MNTEIKEMINKPLFAKFTDPTTAASLKILRYDNQKVDYVDFELARDKKVGLWTIPSHESYPADAGKQMSEAANLFIGMKVVDIATEKKSEQTLFGVVEPNKQNTDKGGEGVGMLVQMRDEKGDMLADIIIGKEIDKKKRYVRVPSEDVIYVVEIDTTPLSTDFKQWIEPDLLKLSSNDIETLGVRDYQILATQQGLALQRTYEADLIYTTSGGQWQPLRITSFENDPPTERPLSAEEQLNATKLNEIKSTLDNLKIADVVKKPAGLAADLKGDSNLLKNPESLMSLQRRGFFPNPNQKGGDTIDFYSKSGELIVTLKDGVQYLLRFGGAAGAEINATDTADNKVEGKEGDSVSINRFMLVTTRLDESKFPQPDLERIPETIEELKALERMKQQPADLPSTQVPELEPATNEPKATTTEPEPKSESPTEPSPAEPTPDKPTNKPAEPASTKPAEPASTDVPAPAAEKPEPLSRLDLLPSGRLVAMQDQQTEAKKGDEATKTDASKADASAVAQEPTEQEWKEKLDAVREKITKENKRKIDERDEKLKKARNKVAELNGRFADWYYVVSEADYKKLKVSISELIQLKTAAGASTSSPPSGFPGGSGAFPGMIP